MIKAVLLDLDNTLLANPDAIFASAFLDIFQEHFASAGVVDAAKNFRRAIQMMSSQQLGDKTNYELTIEALGDNARQIDDLLQSFYTDEFIKLKRCISAIDGASDLIYQLHEMDYVVVIATNPIYPEVAIRQRMAWAGLPLDDNLYALITSADNMHFAKPDPAYYGEILGRIGFEPDEVVMIGDSERNDILPARQLGIHSLHAGDSGLQSVTTDLKQLSDISEPLILNSEMIEPQLRGNIGALHGLVSLVQNGFWHQRPDPNEWSIVQILCHLLSSEEENERKRLIAILEKDNPFIIQSDPPGPDIEVCADDGFDVFRDFIAKRQETIRLIGTFSEADWLRLARHSIFGLTTMLEMAYFTAQHDRLHLKQLCQTIGRCEDVI